MRPALQTQSPDLGFQIAPMIDVVFVILVFFMALAAQLRVEQILATKLPGVAASAEAVEFFDEQLIAIGADGEVALNDEPYDSPASHALPQLTATLLRLKETSDAAQTKVVVTLTSHPDSPYFRTIDVLNALAAAGITQVTFTTVEEEF